MGGSEWWTCRGVEAEGERRGRKVCRPVSDFRKLGKVGQGVYGTVYRALDGARLYGQDRSMVALKKIVLHGEKVDGFPLTSLREVAILRRVCGHPYIVQLLDLAVGQGRDSVFLVFEYCDYDLGYLLQVRERPFTRSEVKRLVLQLLSAVSHLHDNWIVHRDLKMANLLYTSTGQLKLADFGLARTFGYPTEPLTPTVVTLWYRSPELLLGCDSYTSAIDMWAVGCILGELGSGRPLFPGISAPDQLHRICKLLGRPTERIWPGLRDLKEKERERTSSVEHARLLPSFDRYLYSNLASVDEGLTEKGLALLGGLLTYDPGKRLTADEALHHQYLTLESPHPKEERYMPTFPPREGQQ